MSLGSRTLGNPLRCPLNPYQLLAGSVGVRRRFFPLPHLSRETEKKNTEFSVVNLSAKQFPGSMVVLNYLHVSNIFNSFFFLMVLITKMQCPWGRDPAPWPATFQVSFII